MDIIIASAAQLIFTVTDAVSDSLLFRDRQRAKKFNVYFGTIVSDFHTWQAIRQATLISICAWVAQSWPFLILGAAAFWLIHDGIVNRYGLSKPFFFVGTTAWIDRQFQRFQKPETAAAIAKIGILVAAIVLEIIV